MRSAADFIGHRVVVIQAGPGEFVASIQTKDGIEIERSPRYLPNPYSALAQAMKRIKKLGERQ